LIAASATRSRSPLKETLYAHRSGKKAIVTRSTGGIGFGIALGLARAGGAVLLNGRDDT
jgi:hypothetical protein